MASLSSIPQPTGTSMKMCSASAPRSIACWYMRSRCATLCRVTVVLICIDIPRRRSSVNPRTVEANEPSIPRKLSCVAASGPSKLIATRSKPTSTTRWAMRSSMIVPLVARAMCRLLATAVSARSKRSGRISGSPPENTRIGRKPGGPQSGSDRIRAVASGVLRSSWLNCRETSSRRQCTHARLHAAVVSQNSSRSGGAAGVARWVGSAAALMRISTDGPDARPEGEPD